MKRTVSSLFLIICLLVSASSFAQYQKGDKLLNLGVGLNSYYGGGLPIGAAFEVGVTDEISVGAQVDYYTWNYNYGFGAGDWRYTFIPIALRGSYHVNELLNLGNDKIDLYGGAQLGYIISRYTYDGPGGQFFDNSYGNRALFGIHLGGRYYFKPNLAAFTELGYGIATLKLGVTLKF